MRLALWRRVHSWTPRSAQGGRSAQLSTACSPRDIAVSVAAAPMVATTLEEKLALLRPEEAQTPVWPHFFALTNIPRPSGKEQRVMDYIVAFAEERGLKWQRDAVGNLVVRRPGSGGGEGAVPVAVQNHVDMVTEKNADVEHDFLKDPVRCKRDGDWIAAVGTTLGADNGVGAATALALLDMPASAKLPPLECLFTVDEETGMTGAFQLDGSMLTGRTLLNLDSEDWGHVFVGCAGGGDTKIRVLVETEGMKEGMVTMRLSVTGLMGGHSGLNIHEGRGNATQMVAAGAARVLMLSPVHGCWTCVQATSATPSRARGGRRWRCPRGARGARWRRRRYSRNRCPWSTDTSRNTSWYHSPSTATLHTHPHPHPNPPPPSPPPPPLACCGCCDLCPTAFTRCPTRCRDWWRRRTTWRACGGAMGVTGWRVEMGWRLKS